MADRYTYLFADGAVHRVGLGDRRSVAGVAVPEGGPCRAGGGVVAASAAVTWRQVGLLEGQPHLYRHTLEVTDGNYLS